MKIQQKDCPTGAVDLRFELNVRLNLGGVALAEPSHEGAKATGQQQVVTEHSTSQRERESTQAEEDEWLNGLPTWAVALSRAVMGVLAIGGGILLAFFGPEQMNTMQSLITSSLFSFGIGMLSAFFLGSLRFRRKNAIIATGSFALFLILLYFFSGRDVDQALLLMIPDAAAIAWI